MKIIEETLLKKTILQLNNYREKHKNVQDFFDGVSSLELNSLQCFSFQKDSDFFNEISLIISVINSIIAHPHISNKGESIILRSEQAGKLTNENFQQTCKEHALWKEKNFEMVPEYVYYHQYIDELNIYENLFIVLLIDLIDSELKNYTEFYINLIPSLDSIISNQIVENQNVETTLKRLDNLERKIRYIKNTYFYKQISKVSRISKSIKPTNILLKDRLYNLCFKFYRKFIQYEDTTTLLNDFRLYYFMIILQEFRNRGFSLNNEKSNLIDKNNYNLFFNYEDYSINLKINELPGIWLEIGLKDQVTFKHHLLLDHHRVVKEHIKSENSALTTNIATIWNIIDQETLKPKFINPTTELEIVKYWLDNLFYQATAKKEVYTKYCPICKSHSTEEENGIYNCTNCKTVYTFKSSKGKDVIWFINLRR